MRTAPYAETVMNFLKKCLNGTLESVPAGLYDTNMCSSGWLTKLGGLEPGLELAALLAAVEGEVLSGFERVAVLQAHQRMASFFQAQMFEKMASISDLMSETETDPEIAAESAAAEIRAALRLTRRAADADLALAVDLRGRLPRVWAALAAGEIDLRRVRVLVQGTAHLAEETARLVVDGVIGRAARLTTGQLQALLRRLCVEADPAEAAARYREAVADRRIVVEPSVEGTAHLFGLDLPPERVAAAMRRINDLARRLKRDGELRTIDQLRADVFLDLVAGQSFSGGRSGGSVDLQVDLATLAGLDDHPGELGGFGPVIADIARQVAEQQRQASWRWTVTDPDTGQPLHHGITRRRPLTGERRQVETRNSTCIFPGCRMPSVGCDLDHRQPWAAGGPTSPDNLAPLCRHDHRIKHRSGWTYQPLPNGDHRWTSRLGHSYTTSGIPP